MSVLGILGSGDLGKQIAHYALTDGHYDQVVFFDDFATTDENLPGPLMGPIAEVSKSHAAGKFDEAIIGIGYHHLPIRQRLFEELDVPFGTIIHSSCWVDSTAQIADGSVVFPRSVVDVRAQISENTVINIDCTVSHDTVVGCHSFLSPRVAVAGFTEIGSRCILGINSTIIDSIKLTDDVRVGAGTIVIGDLEEPGLYVGNPHRFIQQ